MSTTTVEQLLQKVHLRRDLPAPARRREIREAAGVSLEDIAGVIGVSYQAVSSWERGTRAPRDSHAAAYVAALRALEEAVAA